MKTILIIDDNPTNLGVLFESLNSAGYRTLVSQEGKDAIELAEKVKPDLILLDIIMPEIDGFSVCNILKEKEITSQIPIFFITAMSDTDNKLSGFKSGAVDYICKPFQKEEVLARIRTHIQLQEQKEKLLKINREKEKVISTIAHDLRNPFNSLLGILDFLSNNYESLDEDTRKEYINYARSSSNELYTLTEKMIEWVFCGGGFIDMRLEPLVLSEVVENAVSIIHSMALNKKISIANRITAPIKILADENMISAVLRNLMSNAIKYTPEGGNVSLSAGIEKNRIIIRVEDTGIGINPEMLEKIISGTGGVSTPGTAKENGNGLGLVICKEFIEKHKGWLTVTSGLDVGTIFTISLPIYTAE